MKTKLERMIRGLAKANDVQKKVCVLKAERFGKYSKAYNIGRHILIESEDDFCLRTFYEAISDCDYIDYRIYYYINK